MVLPCRQDREGAGVEQKELRELRGGGGARVLQEKPGGRVRRVGDGCTCGCDVGVGEVDGHCGVGEWGRRCDGEEEMNGATRRYPATFVCCFRPHLLSRLSALLFKVQTTKGVILVQIKLQSCWQPE